MAFPPCLAQKWLAKMPKTRRQNENENFQPRRIVAIRNWGGVVRATPRTPRSCDGPRGSLSMRPLGLAGQRPLQARLARLCRSHRSPSDRRRPGVSPHHTITCTDAGGRVTDGAGSFVAAEGPDRARAVALRPRPGWCGCVYKPGWLWPLRMAKRASKSAMRGGERQSTEAPGHRTRARQKPGGVRRMAERAASRASPCAERRETHKQGRHRWHSASSQGNCVSLSCSSPASSYLSEELTCPKGNPAEKRFLLCRGAGPGSFTDPLRKSGVIAVVFLLYGMCSPPACAPGVRPSPKPEACFS